MLRALVPVLVSLVLRPPAAEPRPVPPHPLDAPLTSAALPSGLHNPMPGGIVGGYPADTGLDIAGFHLPVYALAAGTLVYSEAGHTRWATDDRAVLLELDAPIAIEDHAGATRWITHVWYAHLSALRFEQPRHHATPRRIAAGELLGIAGIANRSPHLHLGLLLDGVTDQRAGSFLLDEACRVVLGNLRRGQRLPRPADDALTRRRWGSTPRKAFAPDEAAPDHPRRGRGTRPSRRSPDRAAP